MRDFQDLSIIMETVTPTWMMGATNIAELRPASTRGCLRFWYRALVGRLLGDDLPTLRAAESAVLGDTSQASRIVVRATGAPKTGNAAVSAEEYPGVQYMFWSPYQRGRDAIVPGERLTEVRGACG